jgi:hypothetical protein
MDAQEMLDFIKALSDTDRLRIVGLLTRQPLDAAEIADAMNLTLQETIRHLFHLEHGNIVIRSVDGLYTLDNAGLEQLTRQQFEGTQSAYHPASTLKDDTRRVLAAHLNPDGTIKQIPAQAGKKQIILEYVVNAFELGRIYSEREVNLLLTRFHKDTSSLRRYLIDAGMLARQPDGSKYWRPQ